MGYSPATRDTLGVVLFAAALLLVPVVFGMFRAYEIGTYLLYGVAAQGIALAWGRTGFLPLGQSLFFGLGAYLGGRLLLAGGQTAGWYALLPLVALVPAAIAYVVARLVFHRQFVSGPNFSLITLALVLLAAQVANRWVPVTGGFNGLSGVPEIMGLGRYDRMYFLISTLAIASTGLLVWLYRTPLGTLWAAIAQNESRLQFLGYPTAALKATAFAISAALAGLAGLFFASQQGLVTPQAIGFQLSASLLIWTAVGGRFGPYGAMLGAVAVGWLSSEARALWDNWEIVVATAFVLVVLALPGGLASLGAPLWRRLLGGGVGHHAQPTEAPPLRFANRAPQQIRLDYQDAKVRLGDVDILGGLSLMLDQPGIHCMIGPNGAGKTSSFNVLTGRLPLTSGDIRVDGALINGFEAHRVARLGIGRKLQIPSVFRDLTVNENLSIAMWAMRLAPIDYVRAAPWGWRSGLWRAVAVQFPFLDTAAQRKAGELSQGQRQMLELAMTLLAEPRLLLLDEPCAGLSTSETELQVRVIQDGVARLNNAAVVIEHDMSAVEQMSHHVHVLHQGRLLFSGDLAGAKASPAVQAVYSGGRK